MSPFPGADDTAPLDLRGPVLAGGAWFGTWVGTLGSPGLLWGALGGGLAVAVLALRRRRWLVTAVALLVLVTAGLAGTRSAVVHGGPLAELAAQHAIVTVESVVGPGAYVGDGAHGSSWWSISRVDRVEGRGQQWLLGQQVRLVAGGERAQAWQAVVPGSRIRATLRLEPAESDDAVGAIGRAREPPLVIGEPDRVAMAVHRTRQALREAAAGLPAEPAALLPALVVGDTSLVTAEVKADFQVTGLTHLTAVSGANLTLLLASLLWLARRVGVRGWWLRLTAVVGVAAFVVLCHSEPSVLRAAAMGSVGLAALGWGGRQQGLRYLSWSVIGLLLIDPWLSGSFGFILSVVASGGIIGWAGRWTDALATWQPRALAEALAVPLAAQLATQPVVTVLSGQVSLVGLLTNLAAGPLVGPTTVVGLACAVVAPFAPAVAAVLAWIAGWGAQALCWIAHLGAALPTPAISWPLSPGGVAIVTVACLTALAVGERVLRRRWPSLLLALALVTSVLRPLTVPGWPPPQWQVVACDVGQGSATVVTVAAGQAIVIDTGPEPKLLERCLAGLGVDRVPLLVISHFHADHVGGTAGLGGRPVDAILAGAARQPAGGVESVRAAVPSAPWLTGVPGLVLSVGEARVEVLSATPVGAETGGEGESSAENDASLLVRIRTPSLSVMTTGDLELDGQSAALRASGDLSADVLIVPHHGSARQSREFLSAVGAPVALIGVGLDNDYGHPSPNALRLLAEIGPVVHRTDTSGSLAVSRSEGGLRVTLERAG